MHDCSQILSHYFGLTQLTVTAYYETDSEFAAVA